MNWLKDMLTGPYRAELFIAFGALGCLVALFAYAVYEYIREWLNEDHGDQEWRKPHVELDSDDWESLAPQGTPPRLQGNDRPGDGRAAATSPDAGVFRAGEHEADIDSGLPGIPTSPREDLGPRPLLSLMRRQAGD